MLWYKKDKNNSHRIFVADPALGLVVYNEMDFKKCWISTSKNNENNGVVLLLQPGTEFTTMRMRSVNTVVFVFFFVT